MNRKVKLPILLFIAMIFFNNMNNVMAQNAYSDKKAITALKNFYTNYINQFLNKDIRVAERNLDSLKRRYCTKKLLGEIPRIAEDIDCDPILYAQDSSPDCLKTLAIKQDSKTANFYTVSYADEYSQTKFVIHLSVIWQGNALKIDSLWYPKVNPTKPDSPETKAVKDFYFTYILATSSRVPQQRLSYIKSLYWTKTLLDKFEKETKPENLDPFLKSYNSSHEWLKTLSVKKDPKNADHYTVSYIDDKKQITLIQLALVRQPDKLMFNDGYKINSIW